MPIKSKRYKLLGIISDLLSSERSEELSTLLESLSFSDLARIIESLPPEQRLPVWMKIKTWQMANVLLEVNRGLRSTLIGYTSEEKLMESLASVEMDELADLDSDLPTSLVHAMVTAMDYQHRKRYELVKDYPDNTAGGLMDADALAIRSDVTLKSVLRFMRRIRAREGQLSEHLDSIMVVDRANRLCGILPLSQLISMDLNTKVSDVMVGVDSVFKPLQLSADVVRIFTDKDLFSAPVVDDNGVLLGRITVDDVIDVIHEESDRVILGRAGLDSNQDMFAPVLSSSLHRGAWLGINLATAFLAAWVIGNFEASIDEIVALAVLMPVVASMGGIAGSQTLTLVTRAMALDQIGKVNIIPLLWHELSIGGFNGLFWGGFVSVVAYSWFGDWLLGAVFGVALLIGIITGVIAGSLIPLILKRIGIDPALAGGVVLTTATDVVGFFAFLGLATVIIL